MRKGEGKTCFELYDLAGDISESNDVSEVNPEIVARMQEILASARTAPDGPDALFAPMKSKKGKKE